MGVFLFFLFFLKKETSKICQETSKNEWQKRTANYSKNGVQFAFEFKFWRSKFKVRKMNAVRERKLLLAFIAQACQQKVYERRAGVKRSRFPGAYILLENTSSVKALIWHLWSRSTVYSRQPSFAQTNCSPPPTTRTTPTVLGPDVKSR